MEENKKLLYRLSELDYFEVADKDTDITGWKVYDLNDERIGDVNELIVDPGAMKVRYVEITLGEGLVNSGRPILIPIGDIRIDDNKVRLNSLSKNAIDSYPIFEDEIVTRAYENKIRHVYNLDFITVPDPDIDFYENPIYDDSFYRTYRKIGRI